MITELTALLVTCTILAYFYWTRNYKYWESRGIPCLPAEFPWGSLKEINPFKQNISHFLQSLYDSHNNEPMVGFYGPTEPFLMVKDLDLVKSVLVTDFKSFHKNGYNVYGSIDPIMRYNAFGTQELNEWKNIRGILSPLFTQNKVKNNIPQMMQISKSMIEYIRDHREEELNAKTIAWNFAVDSVLSAGFGIENDSFKVDPRRPNRFMSPVAYFGSERSSNAAAWCSFFLPWLALLLRCRLIGKNAGRVVTELGDTLVDKRQRENDSRDDVVQRVMLKIEKDKKLNNPGMSKDVKTAQYMTFIIDGFETASNALINALYDLASHADIQEKLRQEILAVSDKIDDFDEAKIISLQYLNKCVYESLRLRTPIPVLTRRCAETTSLGSLTIQQGTKIFIPTQSIQTDPNHFPDPLQYNPDRFDHFEDPAKHPALFCYGDGPRICMGMRHAHLYLKIALIALLLTFRISPANNLQLQTSFFFLSTNFNLNFESL